jgi:hypothetical protein
MPCRIVPAPFLRTPCLLAREKGLFKVRSSVITVSALIRGPLKYCRWLTTYLLECANWFKDCEGQCVPEGSICSSTFSICQSVAIPLYNSLGASEIYVRGSAAFTMGDHHFTLISVPLSITVRGTRLSLCAEWVSLSIFASKTRLERALSLTLPSFPMQSAYSLDERLH